MASQRVLLFTIAGPLSQEIWSDIERWSDARQSDAQNEWSPDDWPTKTHEEVDRLVARLIDHGFTPPILYRSEHVDLWSMGDVFTTALVKPHPDGTRQLFTCSHEVIATRVRFTEQIIPDADANDETRWLYSRINEAIAAWGSFAEERLVVLVRTVLGGLWTDDDVSNAVGEIPSWWNADNNR